MLKVSLVVDYPLLTNIDIFCAMIDRHVNGVKKKSWNRLLRLCSFLADDTTELFSDCDLLYLLKFTLSNDPENLKQNDDKVKSSAQS